MGKFENLKFNLSRIKPAVKRTAKLTNRNRRMVFGTICTAVGMGGMVYMLSQVIVHNYAPTIFLVPAMILSSIGGYAIATVNLTEKELDF